MASSTLFLSIDKGPKKGETLACNPGTVIRIGRVVTGNTLAIKDPGISQKHLTVCFLPEITRWVVTDLGSSNGTYVNGALISPEEPSSLTDGDTIKVGERTSISVNISTPVAEPLILPRCGRPPRLPKAAKLEDEELDEKVDEPAKNGKRGKPKGRKGGGSVRDLRKDDALDSGVVERRVTRASARAGLTRVSVNKLEEEAMLVSNSEFSDVAENEKQSIENNAGFEEEVLAVDGEKNSRVEEVEDDMNNMTLGEWFDRMEEYLPKSINKIAEEIIAELREKAQLFDEYVSQTSNVLVE